MRINSLFNDPYNIILTGVGGQGNVVASRILSSMLVCKGYFVTIGETFGASQRGGPVMSHIRISSNSIWSPQIPRGKADIVAALEPLEAIRVLTYYGNSNVKVLANVRPIYPPAVNAGELIYPGLERIKEILKKLSQKVWFIDATGEAVKLGDPIMSNIILIGALTIIGNLPLDENVFLEVISKIFPKSKSEENLTAFILGKKTVRSF